MSSESSFHRFREAGEPANINNVERFGEPVRSLFTSTPVFTIHHKIEITDDMGNVVYRSESAFPSIHDKTDVTDRRASLRLIWCQLGVTSGQELAQRRHVRPKLTTAPV